MSVISIKKNSFSSGTFRNPVTGEELALLDAIKAGYLMADLSPLEQDQDDQTYQSYLFHVFEDTKYKVFGVVHPISGLEVSLKSAIQEGIIDPQQGVYRNPQTGEVMPIEEAIRKGLIKCRLFNPFKDREDDTILTFQQLKIKKQTFKAGEPGLVSSKPIKPDANMAMLDKLKDLHNIQSVNVFDPNSQQVISLEDAILQGLIDLPKGTWRNADGHHFSLFEACAQGHLEPSVLEVLMKAYDGMSLGDLIKSGEFDPDTGLFFKSASGQSHTLKAAIESGSVDPEKIYFFDVPTNQVTSLLKATESGRLDSTSSKIQTKSGENLSVSKAIKQGEIIAEISPQQLSEKAATLNLLRGCMDTSMKGIKIPNVSETASLEEAVVLGAVNVPKAVYADEDSVGSVPLQLAVQMEKVEPAVAMSLFAAFDEHSLEKAIMQGIVEPNVGQIIDSETNRAFTLDQAKECGVSDPDYIFLVDQETGNITTLGTLVEKGKLDPNSGCFISEKTEQPLSLTEAISQGLILPSIEPSKYVDTTCSLKDLIDSGKVNPRCTDFVAGDGLRMSIRDGLANGFLTMNSKVQLDPETGEVMLMSDEAVVKSLIEVSTYLFV